MGARQTPQPLSAADYCRRARRLRHVLRHDPALLHHSLRQLADRQDTRPRTAASPGSASAVPTRVPSRGEPARPGPESYSASPDCRNLAGEGDRSPLSAIPLTVWRSPSQCQTFARQVEAMLDGVIIRYSTRQILLQQAARRGIARFEANLVIAAVQHRVRQSHPSPATPARPNRRRFPTGLALFATIQAVIFIAVWQLFVN